MSKREPEFGTDLHCGACMTSFATCKELNDHMKTCPAASTLLLPLYLLMFAGEKRLGHPAGRLFFMIPKNTHLIKRYAHAIADDMNSIDRAKIHFELCEKLDLDYKTFRPFESELITSIPSRDEAERILWDALGQRLRVLLTTDKD